MGQWGLKVIALVVKYVLYLLVGNDNDNLYSQDMNITNHGLKYIKKSYYKNARRKFRKLFGRWL